MLFEKLGGKDIMDEKISLDELTSLGVSVVKKKTAIIDGKEYLLGSIHRRSYSNSESGRADISTELPQPYLSAVMSVWGEEPLVVYPESK